MYLLVIHDVTSNTNQAATFEHIEVMKAAFAYYRPERGFYTMAFKLDPKSEIYEEIFPEVLDYEQI